jgi:hypothetical protein
MIGQCIGINARQTAADKFQRFGLKDKAIVNNFRTTD